MTKQTNRILIAVIGMLFSVSLILLVSTPSLEVIGI